MNTTLKDFKYIAAGSYGAKTILLPLGATLDKRTHTVGSRCSRIILSDPAVF